MAPTATLTSYEYAAGTCTLRLVGELSPLGQVTGKPVLRRSRFTIQVRGDDQAPATTNQAVRFEASGREPQFSALAALVERYVQRHLNVTALGRGEIITQGASSLQPVGLTRHRLTLSADEGTPTTVDLSTLQLADLADALEQADGSVQIVPDGVLSKVSRPARPRLSLWLGSVAAVGIAALLGNQFLTTAPGPVVFSPRESQTLNGATNGAADSAARDERQSRLEEAVPETGAPQTGVPQTDAPETGSTADSTTPAASAPAAAGEALPAPVTTAPTTPTGSGQAATPQVSPQTPAAGSAPGGRSPQPESSPAAPPQAEARPGARLARPDSDTSLEQPPSVAGGSPAPAAPARPDTFDASPEIATTAAPATALDWIAALTDTLQQQWRPPANLAAPLRYRLTLGPDGTVEALEPLNDFSANYQNTPTLPQPGDTLLGVVRDDTVTVEVQFLPSGEVVVAREEKD